MPTLEEGFFDRTQPEYLFTQFFGLNIEVPLVKERLKQFLIKMPLVMIGLVIMKFFIIEVMPPIFGLILTAVLYYLVVYLLVKYLILINKMTRSNSVFGLMFCISILIILVLVI